MAKARSRRVAEIFTLYDHMASAKMLMQFIAVAHRHLGPPPVKYGALFAEHREMFQELAAASAEGFDLEDMNDLQGAADRLTANLPHLDAEFEIWNSQIHTLLEPYYHPQVVHYLLAFHVPFRHVQRSEDNVSTTLLEIPLIQETLGDLVTQGIGIGLTGIPYPDEAQMLNGWQRLSSKFGIHMVRKDLGVIVRDWWYRRVLKISEQDVVDRLRTTESAVRRHVHEANKLLMTDAPPGNLTGQRRPSFVA